MSWPEASAADPRARRDLATARRARYEARMDLVALVRLLRGRSWVALTGAGINLGETRADALASVRVEAPAGRTLAAVAEALEIPMPRGRAPLRQTSQHAD